MQSLYAFTQSENDNIKAEEKLLRKSMDGMYDLFLLNLSLLIEVRNKAQDFLEKSQQKHLATEADKSPNLKFLENKALQQLDDSDRLTELLQDRKLTQWSRDDEYVAIIWNALKESELYETYIETTTSSFKEDKNFLIGFFKEIVAPNEKLHEYLEDQKLTWMDDHPIVNTTILKFLRKLKADTEQLEIPRLFKNREDEDFASELFRKTLLNESDFEKDIVDKTPNWDRDRIAEIDSVLLKLAIAEFLKFPSIPVKVTINEYLEIAKEYSTPKSSIFINGVLDKLSKEYEESKKLNKMGRGLM